MKLTDARIKFLTPIVRNLARQFEPQAAAAAGFTAEDLEQEAWLKLTRIGPPPKELDKPDQWFSAVVRRRFLDIVNKGKARLHPTFYGELNGYDREESDVPDVSVTKRIKALNAINRLPSCRQRLIMRARYGIGQDAPETVPQLAARFNVTPRTIQREINASLAAIRAESHPSPS